METVIQQLDQLHELLSDPEHFFTGQLAAPSQSEVELLNPCDPKASCFCILGGAARVLQVACDVNVNTEGSYPVYRAVLDTPLGEALYEAALKHPANAGIDREVFDDGSATKAWLIYSVNDRYGQQAALDMIKKAKAAFAPAP